jgi:hypothetical protein
VGTPAEFVELLRWASPRSGEAVDPADRYVSGRICPGSGVRRLGSPVHVYRAAPFDLGRPAGPVGAVNDYVDAYVPVREVSGAVLAGSRRFVTMSGPESRKVAKARMVAVVGYLAYRAGMGFSLSGGDLFSPASIVDYVANRTPTVGPAAKAQYQRSLREVAFAVLGPAAFPPEPVVIGARDPQPPYTAGDIVTLWGRATGARTEALRRDLSVMVAGGLGAGLTTADWRLVRGTDVAVNDDGVVVHVPDGKVRAVPVLARWEDTIAAAAVRAGDGFLLRPAAGRSDRNLLSRLITVGVSGDQPKLNAQRLRATWIVWHLCSRTPLDVLATAAGIDRGDSGAIARYLRFVPDMDAGEARALLRAAHPGRSV